MAGDIDIAYSARLKDLTSATREVYYEGVKIDSLSLEITQAHYTEILEENRKGMWEFVLSAVDADTARDTIVVPDYAPTADLSSLEMQLIFEEGKMPVLALPAPLDINIEDRQLRYSGVECSDSMTQARIINDSLYITNAKRQRGPFMITLVFGSEECGIGRQTASGEILDPTVNWFNPFIRPVKGTYYYGSGDANQDGFIDSLDVQAIENGIETDEADIDGNKQINSDDKMLLEDYLKGNISYLPGHYEKLETKVERDDWVQKMMDIDSTNWDNRYVQGDAENCWVSGNYASQTSINFFGYYDDEIQWDKYDLSENRRFNLPIYYVHSSLDNPDGSHKGGHGMSAILTGDYTLEFDSWNFIEPQTDYTNVQPEIGGLICPFQEMFIFMLQIVLESIPMKIC
ncbi:MAG: hypothetical protein U5N56_08135 [Candidatus Marinimicrobia bacterium]|nr:hypothetical protein [Candidatus Neomarinimicrobiota bacterium]